MDIGLIPKLNLEFENIEEAWEFWRDYGRRASFGVRKQKFYKSRKDGSYSYYLYVCCKEGLRKPNKRDEKTKKPRQETRTGCEARMKVVQVNRKYKISEVFLYHNHPLQPPEAVHMLASYRRLTPAQEYELEVAERAGISQRSTFNLMSKHAGGRTNLGYTRVDAKNYLNSRRQRAMAFGEAGCLFNYFEKQLTENPSFFHAHQMDSEEQVTNVFWADARMLIDYVCFGEVISLDTTYCTNRDHRPLAIFSGFNYYKGGVIFGVALLYDETIGSFKWLLETFLRAHKNVMPLTIFTDQDAAMAHAIGEVMPNVKHALCTWHISRNAMKHLKNAMKDGSHIVSDFNNCMYHCWDKIEFEEAWQALLSKYNMEDNPWLMSMYRIKEKWAACYIKNARTLGMRSTQISESVNASVKGCTSPKLDINQFLEQFEDVLKTKRFKEVEDDFKARDKLPRLILQSSSMLHQLSQVYTKPIFDLFQREYDLRDATRIEDRKERKINEADNDSSTLFDYVITVEKKKGKFLLTFDPSTETITCSCKKFERVGILCCHALRIFLERDIKLLPKKYVIKRWTREARCGAVYDIKGKQVEDDPKLHRSNRFRQLCPMLVKLASDASESSEAFSLVHEAVLELTKKVTELHVNINDSDEDGDIDGEGNHGSNYGNGGKVIGWKKRDGRRIKKRLKSWVDELHSKRRRRNPSKDISQLRKNSKKISKSDNNSKKSSQSRKNAKKGSEATQMTQEIANSAPQVQCDYMVVDAPVPSQMTFINLLMAPLDYDMPSLEAIELTKAFTNDSHINTDHPTTGPHLS